MSYTTEACDLQIPSYCSLFSNVSINYNNEVVRVPSDAAGRQILDPSRKRDYTACPFFYTRIGPSFQSTQFQFRQFHRALEGYPSAKCSKF